MRSPSVSASPLVRQILGNLSRAQTSTVQEHERSALMLLLLSGLSNLRISITTAYTWAKAKRWRDRWLSYEKAFEEIEGREKKYHMEHDLEEKIKECLSDAPRSGSPGKFTAEQYCQILGVSLEDPKLSQRPITEWTIDELQDEVQLRGIVSSISRSHLGAFFKRSQGETA